METFLINIIQLFLISFFISIHFILVGSFIYSRIIKINEVKIDLSKNIFIACFFISNLLLLVNFLIPLGKLVTTILFVIPFLFFYLIEKNLRIKVVNYSLKFALFSLFLIAYDNINRPDGGLYHYPFMKIINENKIIIGSANLHFRFGHTSIVQYLSAGFNNYFFNEKGMFIPLALIFYSSGKYFYDKIKLYMNKNNILFLFSFLVLFQILFDMNRYSEFGNDVPAHLIVFIACFYFLEKKFLQYEDFFYLSIMTIFAFEIKATIFVIFLLPFYILIKNLKFLIEKKNLFIIIIIFSWFLKNILVSGCFVFPVKFTCSENILWSTSKIYNINSPQRVSEENEAWAKAWPDRKNGKLSYSDYLNEGWVSTWIKSHGQTVILKKILPLTFILILTLFLLIRNYNLKNLEANFDLKKKLIILQIVGILGTLLWFAKFPTYRYGASYIIISLICLIVLLNINKTHNKLTKHLNNFILIVFTIIIAKYISKFDGKKFFFPEIYSFVEKSNNTIIEGKYLRKIYLNNKFSYYTTDDRHLCMYLSSPCTNIFTDKSLNEKEMAGYKIFYLDLN